MSNLYSVPLQNAVQRSLGNTLNQGETTTITFSTSVSGVLQASASMPGLLVIDRVDANGTPTPSLTEYISFTGVSGSTVTGLTRGLSGTTDIAHSVGAIVEFVPDVTWANAINDTFTDQHNADGTHKISAFNSNGAVLASNVSGAVNQITTTNSLVSTSPRITATGTDTDISLGLYGKGGGNVYPQIKAERISATGNSSATGTAVDVTGATVTFTPPFNAMAIVNTVFDCNVGVNNDIGSGYLNVNGTDQSQTAIMQQSSNTNRLTIGQTYAVSLASGTSCTLKLRIIRNSGTGVFTAYSPHTGFSYFLIAT